MPHPLLSARLVAQSLLSIVTVETKKNYFVLLPKRLDMPLKLKEVAIAGERELQLNMGRFECYSPLVSLCVSVGEHPERCSPQWA